MSTSSILGDTDCTLFLFIIAIILLFTHRDLTS